MTDQFFYRSIFPKTSFNSDEKISYRKLDCNQIKYSLHDNRLIIDVSYQALVTLTTQAFIDIAHYFRKDHLSALQKVAQDPLTSENDRFVANQLLKNAVISASGVFPSCQDTGTAIIIAWKGESIWTKNYDSSDQYHNDHHAISKGVFNAYTSKNLRYSQLAALDMFKEQNTKSNLPADIKIYSTKDDQYRFLFIAKGGGSANKTFLFQKSKATLNKDKLKNFLCEAIKSLGTAACPPYHLAVVIGGLSAEQNINTVKLATCRFLDELEFQGNPYGQAFRDQKWEQIVMEIGKDLGIGAQFGGKHFIHSARVIRLPRHAASLVIGIGVSCSADRQILAKITKDGVFLEKLVEDPTLYLLSKPSQQSNKNNISIINSCETINLELGIKHTLIKLDQLKIGTRIKLTGTMIVARDVAHARILKYLEKNGDLPQYFKKFPVYYAGPAKTPEGFASGAFGPTTSQRMDPYVAKFQKHNGSMIMLGKGNRSYAVVESCAKYKGFYLGSIGGPGAIIGKNYVKKLEVLDHEDLGMEAVWKIEIEDFPAFLVTDNKGNDLFLGNKSTTQL